MKLDYDLASTRLKRLSEFLTRLRPLWEERSFARRELSWESDFPAVGRWCRGLSRDEVTGGGGLRGFSVPPPPDFIRWSAEAGELTELPSFPSSPLRGLDTRALANGVPGRKWEQICAFASVVKPLLEPGLVGLTDWCAGKGHLGRLMAWSNSLPVLLLERDGGLCAAGERAALELGVRCDFSNEDVRTRQKFSATPDKEALLSLHACGSLSDDAIKLATEERMGQLFVAGCCYHRMNGESEYRPLSAEGGRRNLRLGYSTMRLATAEEVVARPALRQRRQREMAWRLGVELARGQPAGESSGSIGRIPAKWFHLPFGDFCEAVAKRDGWALRPGWDGEAAEVEAWERSRVVQGLGLVRCLFRRSIEMWVVLDRALYLLEQGREVRLGTFCSRELTPRNTLLVSTLPRI